MTRQHKSINAKQTQDNTMSGQDDVWDEVQRETDGARVKIRVRFRVRVF